MIDFSKRLKDGAQVRKTNPIEIYNTLDRASVTGPLRPAQTNVLSQWYENYREKKDLIIKLHTGAGKTLVGLLIAMSYINSGEGPVIYICPNIYLVQQACEDAQKFGIPFCFINNNNDIPNEFLQGKCVLITHVQKVFNGFSIFGTGNKSVQVGCIILDDSHACIDSMLSSCTIQILKESPAFAQIIALFEEQLRDQGSGTFQDLLNDRANTLMPIPYWSWQSKIEELTKIVSQNVDDLHIKFAWPILRDHLSDCQALVSNSKIEISPLCMPIQQYGIFSSAKHRILMSATTQEDTFFIKGLDLSIESVSNPLTDTDYRWSGEKMILIPDNICEDANGAEIINGIISAPHEFGIAVLTPSFEKAKKYTQIGAVLANDPEQKGMYTVLKEYRDNHKNKTIVFANRYDGIDLPDDTCRILIVDSVPYYDSLSDRYEEVCRSESDIVRIKTVQKIEQGLGRSVRGEKDYSVILVVGSDLIKYLRSITNQNLFSPQTRKQIEIGFEIVEMAKEDLPQKDAATEIETLYSTISQCLYRDEGWKLYYSSMMDEAQYTTQKNMQLYAVLKKEREAYEAIIIRNYDLAAKIYQEIADLCTEETEKGWYLQEKARVLYHISHTDSNRTQVSAFKKNNQLLKPQSGIVYNKLRYPLDYSRNTRILQEFNKYQNYDELSVQVEDILSNMSFGVEAEKAESAFFRMGQLLGYICQRPDKEVRKGPDVLWCVSDRKYILFECKTEVSVGRKAISKTEAGQMEEHCAWFEEEYPQEVFLPLLIIPTEKLADDAYFSHDVKILEKKALGAFRDRLRAFFREFKDYSFGGLTAEFVNEKLVAHKLHNDVFWDSIGVSARR